VNVDEWREDLRWRAASVREDGQYGPEDLSSELEPDAERKETDRVKDTLFLFDRGLAGFSVHNGERGDGSGAKPRRGRGVFQDRVLRPAIWDDYHLLKWSDGRVAAYVILVRDAPGGLGIRDLGQGSEILARQLHMLDEGRAYRARQDTRAAREWGPVMTGEMVAWLRYKTNAQANRVKKAEQHRLMLELGTRQGWLTPPPEEGT
jgi:hypothetical protein